MTAYLTPMAQLRLQDKLDISDGAVFRIQQELGPVDGNDKRLVLYKMFVGVLQDVQNVKKRILFSMRLQQALQGCPEYA